MRTNNNMRVFVLFLFLTCSIYSFSQQRPGLCGNYIIDKAALQKAKEFESRNSANNAVQSASFVIRVYFHILNCSDGSFPGVTAAQLKTEFNTLAAAYSANNICFINAGFDNIYNSNLDTNFNATTDAPSLFNAYRVPNCINVFYPFKIKGSNNACSGTCGIGGTSLAIPNTFCLVANSNVGQGQTVAHEVGHCMGLLHTFEPSDGYEDIDGSNSSTAGDQITDTPADPFAYNGQTCYATSANGCTYAGSCKDPKNASNFSPPYSNLMTYWWANKNPPCYNSLTLTSGQYTRVNSYLNTNSDLQNCESPASVTESGVNISSGYLMVSAINTLITSGTVDISGNAIATLGGSTVLLEPGFDAYAYNGASILIRLSQCSGTSPVGSFTSQSFNSNTILDNSKAKNSLIIYPNPTTGLAIISFTTEHEEHQPVLEVYDMHMRMLKAMSLPGLIAGKQNIPLDLNHFNSGIYIIQVKLQRSTITSKLILIK